MNKYGGLRINVLLVSIIPVIFLAIFNVYAECPDEGDFKNEVDAYLRFIPPSSAKAQSGRVEVIQSQVKYSYGFKLFDRMPVTLLLHPEYTSIDNSTVVELPAHLTGVSTGIETIFPFFNLKNTYLRLRVSPAFYGDDWDFQSRNFRISTRLLAVYVPDEKWAFIAGVAFFPRYEDAVWPLVGLVYKASDRLVFNLTPPRPDISYKLSDRTTVFAEAGFFINEYPVARSASENAILLYRHGFVGGGVRYRFNKFLETSLSAGGVVLHTLKYRDSQGKVGLNNGFYAEFRIQAGI